ncbi:GDP-fucose protein O-fucosyltransferase [Macleaya cordata]|uniref:GDP-fucose protein O-fucosyltransferase 2 n=1 Tax=Macleaya cordata TaxID=56857 RepID=A0A200QL36_MACCD|nr:GDP-fucose protein O-fucosyltransferase [Macleaya cordata]
MERESSDEEEDRENLIDSNERKISRSSFEIGELQNRICRRFRFSKRYLFAICLPIFLILLYFSIDVGSLFRSVSSMKINDSPSNRMREAELRALYLLREQQLGLLNLWNRTSINSEYVKTNSSLLPNANSSSSVNTTIENENVLFEDFRSAVLKQIKLNKEIQQALLSSHRVGNLSEFLDDNAEPPGISGYGHGRCRAVDHSLEKRTIEWKPKSNKYLFAICVSGQMSNHLICLEKHMFFAALLNRILVIPSSKVDYQYNRVLDIDHINKCFGRKVVVSFEEFSELKKNHLHIDRFICYVSLPQPCYVDEEHVKKLKSLGLSMGKLESAWVEGIKKPSKKTVEDITAKFSSNDDVLAIGDVFYADVEQEWVMQPGGPLAHKCKTVIEPSRLIMLTAQRFVQTFLGKNFIALHFRRHGFLKFCNAKTPSCFFPIPQAADCITQVAERANAPVIYLSTDAAESETDLLQSLIVVNGKAVPLVKRPARNSAEKWDALLYRHGLEGDSQVEAMLDKTICAMASVFIGSSGSTFTEDILRLRKDWGSASVCDEYLCQAEQPDFIADNE